MSAGRRLRNPFLLNPLSFLINPFLLNADGRQVARGSPSERELFIDNLMVRIHFIIEMIWWTGLAPWEFEFPFPGSLTSTFQHTRDLALFEFSWAYH